MLRRSSRRDFLQSAAVLGSASAHFWLTDRTLQAAAPDANSPPLPELVRFTADVEPLVRLIEETPQDRCIDMMVRQLREGLPYRRFLAAMYLAGVRSGTPHEVFSVQSAYQLGLDVPVEDRLLPAFWALHNMAGANVRGARLGRGNPLPVLKGDLPKAEDALEEFRIAYEAQDSERAERAVVAVARAKGGSQALTLLAPYAVRSSNDLMHDAIYVASAWRTLDTIGWQNCEPVLRWIAQHLVAENNWAYPRNLERISKLRGELPRGWAGETGDRSATLELLSLIRSMRVDDASEFALTAVTSGKVQAGAIWDAIHLAAAELLMRRRDVGWPVHANTSANAYHFLFRSIDSDQDRLLILLQGVTWQCHGVWTMNEQRKRDSTWTLKDANIVELASTKVAGDAQTPIGTILRTLTNAPEEAASLLLGLAGSQQDAQLFLTAARRLVLMKATGAHDVKFPVAIFEDAGLVSQSWRPNLLAASVFWLQGSDKPDSRAMLAARDALRAL